MLEIIDLDLDNCLPVTANGFVVFRFTWRQCKLQSIDCLQDKTLHITSNILLQWIWYPASTPVLCVIMMMIDVLHLHWSTGQTDWISSLPFLSAAAKIEGSLFPFLCLCLVSMALKMNILHSLQTSHLFRLCLTMYLGMKLFRWSFRGF